MRIAVASMRTADAVQRRINRDGFRYVVPNLWACLILLMDVMDDIAVFLESSETAQFPIRRFGHDAASVALLL